MNDDESSPDMHPDSRCPQCGTPLAQGALAGLCPACLLKAGAAEDTITAGGGAPFTPPTVEELAAKFPQLEILALIGKGGMGAVYKARQKQLDRFVALKILPPGIGDDPAFAERFGREARALAKLSHPNIVTIHDFGQADGLFYLLMEFVDGMNLRQLLAASRVSPREALAIVPQICDALQFAHDHGIVHRDIKPENILLDRLGRVKVADFGLAKLIGVENESAGPEPGALDLSGATEAGKIMGTPQYMAPEQRDNPGEVDHRADIYALGVVFYQMLTGELPGKRIEAPSSKVRIDVRLDEVVLRALEKNPDMRYAQASIFKTQVENISGNTTDKTDATGAKNPTGAATAANTPGKALAVTGVVLQLGCLLGIAVAYFRFLQISADMGGRVVNINKLAAAISNAMATSFFAWIAGILGLVCLSIALTATRYRARWFYQFLVCYSWLLVFVFPVGTAFAIFFLVYCMKRRAEFFEGAISPREPHKPLPGTTPPAKLALGLLLAGVLGTPVLLAMFPRADSIAVFFLLSIFLALVFGIISRKSSLGRGVAWGCVAVIIGIGGLIGFRQMQFKADVRRVQDEMEGKNLEMLKKEKEAQRNAKERLEKTNAQNVTTPHQAVYFTSGTLPVGSLTLVAISRHPSEGEPWWAPDGSPAKQGPFREMGSSESGSDGQAREFVFRAQGVPPGTSGFQWKSDPPVDGGYSGGGHPELNGVQSKEYYLACVWLPKSARTVNIKAGVAMGAWETIGETIPDGSSSGDGRLGDRIVQFSFFKPIEMADKSTTVNLSYNILDKESSTPVDSSELQARLIAVDDQGEEHEGESSSSFRASSDVIQLTAKFPGLPLKRIRKIRFQARPTQWVEFNNVALNPGPVTPGAVPSPTQSAQVVINIHADGSFFLDKKQIDPGTLKARLKELAGKNKDLAVILRCDKKVSYDYIVKMLDLCKEAGIWNVAFATGKSQ